ncbi:MAG TPA: RNA 3'-terminal phosphate cyclase [Thermodesulfobacteriota bacterium]|nr:RNA 3'-terminal phosphate cyclase [Thermodesulfobacteriota bacterium]
MIEIDGSVHSGSGTLLRHAVALAALLGEALHMTRIRAKRDKPGLRPQHVQAVRACADFSRGEIEGAEVGSSEILFQPGRGALTGGDYEWDIGTAGSTTMLASALVPAAVFAESRSSFTITGGVFQDFAPSAFHQQKILVPLLNRMGAKIGIDIVRPGYPPKGQGKIRVTVEPAGQELKPLEMMRPGRAETIRGISLASHLKTEKVASRMAEESRNALGEKGYPVLCEVIEDRSAVQKGAALLLWAETETGCLLGADQAGKPGRRSEKIARFVAASLLEDLSSGAATDRHLADQLIVYAALAGGTTRYTIPRMTDHVESNLWLVYKILGAASDVRENRISIRGVGFKRKKEEGGS